MTESTADDEQRGQMEASIELAASMSSPGMARDFVKRVLRGWKCDHLLDSALLVASELVTNAVLHARSSSILLIRIRAGVVRIEVADSGGGTPVPRVPVDGRPGGRGLPIIEAISLAWGIDAIPAGKRVWADIQS